MKKSLSFKLSIWGAILALVTLIAPLQKAYAAPTATTTIDTKSEDLSKFSQPQVALATVHWTEGIEHAFIRQLVADPANYGFDGKPDDKKAVKHWAGRQAHLLAIKAGYVDKFGAQIGVPTGDTTAYLIQKNADGSLQIVEGMVTTPPPGPTTAPDDSKIQLTGIAGTHAVAATIATAQFIGASATTGEILPVPVYQYVYLG
jgi:hypothetical protein